MAMPISAAFKAGAGTLTLTGVNTYSGGTHINGGTLAVDTDFALGASGTRITFDGGTLAFIGGPTGGINRPITLDAGGGTIDTTLGNLRRISASSPQALSCAWPRAGA